MSASKGSDPLIELIQAVQDYIEHSFVGAAASARDIADKRRKIERCAVALAKTLEVKS